MLFKEKYLKKIDYLFLILSFFALLLIALILRKSIILTFSIFIILSILLLEFIILQVYRRLSRHLEYLIELKINESISFTNDLKDKVNMLSYENLINNLNLNIPLVFSKWTLDVDLLKTIIDDIYQRDKVNILELASGNSTIILSYFLKKLNLGKIYSIEHDEIFFNKTKKLLEINNLNDVCELFFSSLEKIKINNEDFLWYELDFINNIENIDILIVDGPPAFIQKNSRFPALPLLKEKLSQNAVVYLDDGKREDENKIIQMWQKLFPNFDFHFLDTNKGAWKIYKDYKIFNELIKFITEKNKLFFIVGPNINWTFGVSRIVKFPEYISKKGFNVIYLYLNDDSQLNKYEYKDDIFLISVNSFEKILSDSAFINEIQKQLKQCDEKYLLVEIPTDIITDFLPFFKNNQLFIIYDIRDNWNEFKKKGEIPWLSINAEIEILKKSDLVITVAPMLKEKFKDFSPILIPNGFDPCSFDSEFNINLKKGTITLGYYGTLNVNWFDWDFIKKLAKQKKEWIIHLIGLPNYEFIKDLPNNIIYHGEIEHSKLMGYAKNWDFAIIPFKNNEISKYSDPLKIYEFLYFSLPVITKGIPHLSEYPNTYVVNNINEFIKTIEKIIKEEKSINDFKTFIDESTWEKRIDYLFKIIRNKKLNEIYYKKNYN